MNIWPQSNGLVYLPASRHKKKQQQHDLPVKQMSDQTINKSFHQTDCKP